MKNYLVKTPRIFKAIYNRCVWHINEPANNVYLTFDDGPHPEITPWVLQQLKKYNAKATFFCIGKNVQDFPEIYQQILDDGHAVGNHTHNHLNGWKTENETYYANIKTANQFINTKLFRPPYGRISITQAMEFESVFPEMKIIMWDVLSGDFDINISKAECLENVTSSTKPGSIIVFHDSEKAKARMEYALIHFLQFANEQGWKMKKLNF